MRKLDETMLPILFFYRGYRIEPYLQFGGLLRNTRKAIKSNPYTDSFLIDSEGRKYMVLHVQRLGFAKQTLMNFIFLGPFYLLEFTLSDPVLLTTDEMRNLVIKCRKREGKTNKCFTKLVHEATSPAEIIKAVVEGIYGYHGDTNEFSC